MTDKETCENCGWHNPDTESCSFWGGCQDRDHWKPTADKIKTEKDVDLIKAAIEYYPLLPNKLTSNTEVNLWSAIRNHPDFKGKK